ncbi:Fur family transcriptional regulator, zinc uptake regulator [Nitrosomonas cryotolerans]|uniref:Fur family transcriptional regulator, zinc uptake regulator n=1 Tax=Nitrosomonas cryotolerans ATCC 49181 TaxID=1131553 RepID=A0A1N6HUL6_9PROT|nr:Fur family transcriptional regulator [Nitrosomonas cryotolerans]SFP86419.1 Fur family transcriptional regulator, zinc uptake regulator [Nitrosomonas cryotolerans]SIO23558.1 Fur family transcriptional regulator, zinc uptake regulator [Nitrosomonas cryotolerans ATCC 49181]
MPADIDQIIKKSQEACASTGAKLTSKRKNVLTALLTSSIPLSAYEIVEKYKNQFNEALPVMSVYRMLDFLIQEKLVHKLETSGQYMICAHITCDHPHEMPQFLICDRCHTVKEIGIKKQIMSELERGIQSTGFTLSKKQLELHGFCEHCQNKPR